MKVKRKIDVFLITGFTLPELIITVAILAILVMMALLNLKPMVQINKAKDARRKSDLKKIQIAFEDYYGDHNCYPTPPLQCKTSFSPYMQTIPCDPNGGNYDQYLPGDPTTCPQLFTIYTVLSNASDPDILKVGCQNLCGPDDKRQYNFGVSSSNIVLENSERSAIPTPEGEAPTLPPPPPDLTVTETPEPQLTPAYACIEFECRSFPGSCLPNRPIYSIDQRGLCEIQCPNPANQCN